MSQSTHLRKYGVQTTIDFELYEIDGVNLRTDWVPAAADCEVMKDEGTSTQCTNTATDEGSTYSIVLTATEMQASRLVLKIVDAATKVFLDKVIILETYGNPSAAHAFDLDTASTAQTADHAAAIADVPTVSEFNARTLVAASYFDPDADTVANVTATGSVIGAVGSVSGNVDGDVSGSVASVVGHTAQTADHAAGIADIPTVAELNARTLVAASYFDPAADTVANVTAVATLTGHTAQTGDTFGALPTNFSATVISVGGATDSMVQGFLNNTIAETSADNLAANFETFYDNADTLTTKKVDNVGSGGGGDATEAKQDSLISSLSTAQLDLDIITGASGVNLLTATQASIDAVETDTGTTIPATIATAQSDLDIITGASGVNLLTATQASIDAIETDTGTTIPATIATAQSDLDIITGASGVIIAAAQNNAIADAVLNRAASNIEGTADKHSLGAVIMISTNAALAGSTLTAKKPSDDSTFFTYTVTTDSAADAVTGIS